MWIEHRVEGNMVPACALTIVGGRSKSPQKSLKQFLWVAVSLWTGFTFVGYFVPIRQLAGELLALQGSWQIFWVLFYGFATYGNAGFLREQVCAGYVCPYGALPECDVRQRHPGGEL